MERLTEQYQVQEPFDFQTCSICGTSYSDRCMLNIWQECDENDKLENKYIVICKSESCRKLMDEHPRLYSEVQWNMGGPGKFILLCGNCKFRNYFRCTHPDLRENGGEGLEIIFTQPFGSGYVCFHDSCRPLMIVADSCKGFTAR